MEDKEVQQELQLQCILFGGKTPPPNAKIDSTEIWNGSSWTEVNNLNTARITTGAETEQQLLLLQ